MKTFKTRGSRPGGFTLMELLVVVSIIVILAGLTMGVMTFVNQKQAQEQARIQIQLLENALAEYYADNGEYPSNPRSNGQRGTNEIFQALFPEEGSNEKTYLSALDPDNDGQGWISGSNYGSITIVDPWGSEYLYRTNRGKRINAANPGFDLWSSGPDGQSTTGRNGGYERDDRKNRDDIRTW